MLPKSLLMFRRERFATDPTRQLSSYARVYLSSGAIPGGSTRFELQVGLSLLIPRPSAVTLGVTVNHRILRVNKHPYVRMFLFAYSRSTPDNGDCQTDVTLL